MIIKYELSNYKGNKAEITEDEFNTMLKCLKSIEHIIWVTPTYIEETNIMEVVLKV